MTTLNLVNKNGHTYSKIKVKDTKTELARTRKSVMLQEVGQTGIDSVSGYLDFAPIVELRWPSAYPIFNRLRRTDPEVSMVRWMMTVLSRSVRLKFRPGTSKPNSSDKRAVEYLEQMFSEIEGGSSALIDTMVSYTPFMGWAWWEILYGFRNGRPYGPTRWTSSYTDGLPAITEFAWRDHSTFDGWEFDNNGRLVAMDQLVTIGKNPGSFTIPKDKSLHLTFGDSVSPEGLSPFEALYRLERIKYGLEVIFGIGSEHTAGHLSVTADVKLRKKDIDVINTAAENILKAQEGNFATWPPGYRGEIVDSTFSAAEDILEAMRYYGILKLQLFIMQFVSMGATSGSGSYNAIQDASDLAIMAFNSMMSGFGSSLNEQVVKPLFRFPAVDSAFSGRTANPIAYFSLVEKNVDLTALGNFLKNVQPFLPMGSDDEVAIRRRSSFLPEDIPEDASVKAGQTNSPGFNNNTQQINEGEEGESATTEGNEEPATASEGELDE